MFLRKPKFYFVFLLAVAFFIPYFARANSVSLGQKNDFFIQPTYDVSGREKISATLQKIGQRAYFYVETKWWDGLSYQEKQEMEQAIQSLDFEFSQRIYPSLTSVFGFEWKPGIDRDNLVTILIHQMAGEARGYFNEADEYSKFEEPKSNEREMIYLNADILTSNLVKSFLAHEFSHLISFNQKERTQNVKEETWLNEMRAEMAPTIVGYDASEYSGSNLEQRLNIFLENPSDSITEWQNKKGDYGALNIFGQYLFERYGINILTDSLRSAKTGIESLNEALKKNGFSESFSQIFTDWTIAVLVNNCQLGQKYCYQNKNLQNFGVIPAMNFLPVKGRGTLGVNNTTKNWAGNWFQIVGGEGTVEFEFSGDASGIFRVPYLKRDLSGKYSLEFLSLDVKQKGKVTLNDFDKNFKSLVIIPSLQSKISNFVNPEPSLPYFWSVSTLGDESSNNSSYLVEPINKMSREEILAKISDIENILRQLKDQLTKLALLDGAVSGDVSCERLDENLSFGTKNDNQVKCLQQFLKNQGQEIYPEGLVTGNFGTLTRAAVIRFQEKYASEILMPFSLTQGNGFVGERTRAKINELLATN